MASGARSLDRVPRKGRHQSAALFAWLALIAALALPAYAASSVPRGGLARTLLASATPRVLPGGPDGHGVRVSIRNDGTEAWDPAAGFALSYRWRTVFGRTLDIDSARTALPRVVGPGESITLDATLGVPPHAGLYVLEWDMVQERVTWFSQRDPVLPPHTLIVVLPDPALFRAALPLIPALVAGLGLLLLLATRSGAGEPSPRRGQAGGVDRAIAGAATSWDLVWCAASLLFKQLALLEAAQLALTGRAVAVSSATALAPALLLLAWAPPRRRAWLAWLLVLAGSLLLVADRVYFRYFGDVLSMAAVSGAGQLGYLHASILGLLQPGDLWLVADLVVALPFVVRPRHASVGRLPRRVAPTLALLALALMAVPAPLTAALSPKAASDPVFRHLNVVEALGVFGYHWDDAVRYLKTTLVRRRLSPGELADTRRWFARHASERASSGGSFGAARGRNVVFILAESLQGFVVGLRVNGQEVTPTLNRLRAESLWSSSVVDQVGEGRTSDAELINATSLLPLAHGAASLEYPGNHFVSLPRLLADRGYHTFSAVPFEPDFWNRRVTHAAYGFSHSFFAPDFGPGEQEGWGLSDRAFLRQMRPRMRAFPRPFCTWLITLGLHHPFDSFPDALKSMDLGEWNRTRLGNYLHAMHLFDQALNEFLAGLREDGLLDETVVVVEGDHEAGVLWTDVARVAGFHPDTLDWYLADRVPLMIRVPGANAPRGALPALAGQADVPPTLLALLGIDPAPLPYLGRNLLGQPGDGPIVRRYGDWLDLHHLYLSGHGYSTRQVCFDLASRQEVSTAACGQGQAKAEEQLLVSSRVLTAGLQHDLIGSGTFAHR